MPSQAMAVSSLAGAVRGMPCVQLVSGTGTHATPCAQAHLERLSPRYVVFGLQQALVHGEELRRSQQKGRARWHAWMLTDSLQACATPCWHARVHGWINVCVCHRGARGSCVEHVRRSRRCEEPQQGFPLCSSLLGGSRWQVGPTYRGVVVDEVL